MSAGAAGGWHYIGGGDCAAPLWIIGTAQLKQRPDCIVLAGGGRFRPPAAAFRVAFRGGSSSAAWGGPFSALGMCFWVDAWPSAAGGDPRRVGAFPGA